MRLDARSACLAILAVALPARAAAQAATVDQVLAALAEVVKDRARQVAAEAIAAQIKTQICTHGAIPVKPVELRVPGTARFAAVPAPNPAMAARPAGPTSAAAAANPIRLWLGGSDACVRGGHVAPACTPDDVFVRSCQLLEKGEAPLTDPYYLKTLSRDTVDFLLRLSAGNLSAKDYAKYGFAPLGEFVHSVLEQVTSQGVTVGDLASPTLTLAGQLGAGLPELVLQEIGERPATRALEARILPLAHRWVAEGCPYVPDPSDEKQQPRRACAKGKDTAHWFADAAPAGCAEFLATSAERTRTFKDELFAEGTVVSAASEAPCEAANGKAWLEQGRRLCERARLTMNLHDGLTRVSCLAGMAEPARRSALREMIYLLLEQRAYRQALRDLEPEAPGGEAALDAFLAVVRSLELDRLPREELAYGVRLLGAHLAAARDEPDAANAWLARLKADLDAFGRRAGSGEPKDVMAAYQALLHGDALGSGRRPAALRVGELRDAVKDFLLLPAVVVARDGEVTANVLATGTALAEVVAAFQAPGEGRSRLQATLRAFSRLADALSRLAGAVARRRSEQPALATPAGAEVDPAAFEHLAAALKEASAALALAAERDWVGLGIRAVEQTAERVPAGEDREAVLASFRFVRVLLSMYQAASVEEAKAIFQATLEDTASRARRYDRRAWDAGALLGLRGGFQLGRTVGDGHARYDRAGLYGLYAPFGVMTTRRSCGWIFYPVDLGSYLSVTPNSAEEGKPRWQDAFRVGLAGYRRWRDVPVAAGLGTDFRPAIAGRTEWRAFLGVTLELPMYLLK